MIRKIFTLHLKIPLLCMLSSFLSILSLWAEIKYFLGGQIPTSFSDYTVTAAMTLSVFLISYFVGLFFSIPASSLLAKVSLSAENIIKGGSNFEIKQRPKDEIGETIESFEKLRTWVQNQVGSWEAEKNKAEAILQNIGDGVMAIDLKGNVFLFNKMAENITSLKKEELLGQNFQNFIKLFNRQTNEEVTGFVNQALISGKETSKSDIYLTSTRKSKIPVSVVATPIKGQQTLILGSLIVFRDVTSEVELERMRTDLISIASHQLRTPLSEIKGLIELMLEGVSGKLNEKQLEFLYDARKATQRMVDLVNDLLNVTRLEQGRLKFNFQTVNIADLVGDVYKIYEKEVSPKNQKFLLSLPPKKFWSFCDAEKTKEVISNLVSNALKYTPRDGTINLWVAADQRGIWVAVKDNGVGIPKDKQKYLFQKFSRIPNPLSKEVQGTGLGLYAAKQLIEQQNGKMWFESRDGKGSTFAFVLPQIKES